MERKTEQTQKLLDKVARFKDVMQAWVDGKPVEFNTGNGWKTYLGGGGLDEPAWNLAYDYRIKPCIPLQIPWKLIDKKYQWAAKNPHGTIRIFSHKPEIDVGFTCWGMVKVGTESQILPLVNIDPDNVPWKDSLVQRPRSGE